MLRSVKDTIGACMISSESRYRAGFRHNLNGKRGSVQAINCSPQFDIDEYTGPHGQYRRCSTEDRCVLYVAFRSPDTWDQKKIREEVQGRLQDIHVLERKFRPS